MNFKLCFSSILFVSLAHASIIQRGAQLCTQLMQSVSNPSNHINFVKKCTERTVKLMPGNIVGNALNKTTNCSSYFNLLTELLHPDTKKPLFAFFKEEELCPITDYALVSQLGINACINPKAVLVFGLNIMFLKGIEVFLETIHLLPDFKEISGDNIEKRAAKLFVRASIVCVKSVLETLHFLGRSPRTAINKLSYNLIGKKTLNSTAEKLPWSAYAVLFVGLAAAGIQNAYFEKMIRLCPVFATLIKKVPSKNIIAIMHDYYQKNN